MDSLTLEQFCNIDECDQATYYIENCNLPADVKQKWWNIRSEFLYAKYLPPLKKYEGKQEILLKAVIKKIKELSNENAV